MKFVKSLLSVLWVAVLIAVPAAISVLAINHANDIAKAVVKKPVPVKVMKLPHVPIEKYVSKSGRAGGSNGAKLIVK